MITIKKLTNTRIQIDTTDYTYLRQLKDYFTDHVDGYFFMPKFQSGFWNGKISLFSPTNRSLPYGLLGDWMIFHKKNFRAVPYVLEDDVKNLFKGCSLPPVYDLSLFPYDYQEDCIKIALKYARGILRVATAAGKSLIISYIIKTLIENDITKSHLIIVPTIGLVEQFYGDMSEYGIDSNIIGRVYEKYKEFDKEIVISTWQTLSKNHDKLKRYECVVVDECHGAKAHEIATILKKCETATYRLGLTGTLPSSKLDLWNVKSYLGPILREYSSGELAERGYISKCNIKVINIEYSTDYDGAYDEVKDMVFTNEFRLSLIHKLVHDSDHNILLLVGKVEKEGDFLKRYLEGSEKEVIFLSGRNKVEDREYWRKECMQRDNIALIATYGIFQLGINIPNLKYIILAAPFKSKIRVLQSIGRSLRVFANKADGAVIYDIADDVKYLDDHSTKRLRHYDLEKFGVEESTIKEGSLIQETFFFA